MNGITTMMTHNLLINKIKEHFSQIPSLTRDQLRNFYQQFDPDLKESTFNWRIYDLKRKHIIAPIEKNVYSLSPKPIFLPRPEKGLQKLYHKVKSEYPLAPCCVWSTRWLNDFTIHQSTRFLHLLEVERDLSESVFYTLKDNHFKNVFHDPDSRVMEKYVNDTVEAIIVKPLVTKSPVQTVGDVILPTLEKILVDVFCDSVLFDRFQGRELVNIYNHSFQHYQVNMTHLLEYARRRGRVQRIQQFLRNIELPKESSR